MNITPDTVGVRAVNGGHAFISHRYPSQLGLVLGVAQSMALDNGAFSAWTAGQPITDWRPYYDWVGELHRYPIFDFAVIPDVIDGTEEDNDALLDEWPWRVSAPHVGAPVWHMHESLARLRRLSLKWPRICIGSSGQFATVGSPSWWARMISAMDAVCDKSGRPVCKIHGLRMLNPKVFTQLPLSSADSTNIARNTSIDKKWTGTYSPPTKEARADVMRARIEANQGLILWDRTEAQKKVLEYFERLSGADLEKFALALALE